MKEQKSVAYKIGYFLGTMIVFCIEIGILIAVVSLIIKGLMLLF